MAQRPATKASRSRPRITRLGWLHRAPFRASAAWVFLTIWVAATLCVAIGGRLRLALLAFVGLLIVALWSGITLLITNPSPRLHGESDRSNVFVVLQLVAITAIIVVTGHSALVAHGAAEPIGSAIPVWTWILHHIRASAEALGISNHGYILNPVRYFLIPAGLLLLLGARPNELGFCESHRWVRVTLLWSVFGVSASVYALITGTLTGGALAGALMRNALLNGFFEEFLFRGALLTRCRLLLGNRWALVISSLVFGLWHAGAATTLIGSGNPVAASCVAIALHSLGGLAFGVIFIRTRSLLAPSIVHVLMNLV